MTNVPKIGVILQMQKKLFCLVKWSSFFLEKPYNVVPGLVDSEVSAGAGE